LKDYKNTKVYNKNGFFGLKKNFYYDRIIISAGYKKIPEPLIKQLKEGGIITAPIGSRHGQSLIAYKKVKDKLEIIKKLPGFIFVPLVTDQSDLN